MANSIPLTTRADRPGRPVRLFRNLAYLAAAATFALIVVGGIVRISDSGLGCGPGGSGTDGWPLCGGRLIPGVNTHTQVEYTHRILAALVTVILVVLVIMAWRYFHDRRLIVRASYAALGLIVIQAVLGGLTVEKGLKEELVAIHLGVAMIQIGLLLLIARLAQQAASADVRPTVPAPRPIRTLALASLVAMLGTIVAGGYMAAGELHGTGKPLSARVDAHMACGKQFPTCNDAFLPFGESKAVNIHLAHRAFVYASMILIVALLVTLMRSRRELDDPLSRRLMRWAAVVLAVLIGQVLLGALNVWLGEHEWLIVAHLTIGTLLWSALALFSFDALGIRLPAATQSRAPAGPEVVPA